MDMLESGLPGSSLAMSSSSSAAGQFPSHNSLYAANNLSGLGMGSLQNLAGRRPSPGPGSPPWDCTARGFRAG